jgi:hypothetical protein
VSITCTLLIIQTKKQTDWYGGLWITGEAVEWKKKENVVRLHVSWRERRSDSIGFTVWRTLRIPLERLILLSLRAKEGLRASLPAAPTPRGARRGPRGPHRRPLGARSSLAAPAPPQGRRQPQRRPETRARRWPQAPPREVGRQLGSPETELRRRRSPSAISLPPLCSLSRKAPVVCLASGRIGGAAVRFGVRRRAAVVDCGWAFWLLSERDGRWTVGFWASEPVNKEITETAGRKGKKTSSSACAAGEMWRRRLGALLLRSPSSSSPAAASSRQRRRHYLLPTEVTSRLSVSLPLRLLLAHSVERRTQSLW